MGTLWRLPYPLKKKKKKRKEKTECVVLYEVQKTLIKYEGTCPNQIQHNRPIHSWETTKHDLFLSRRQPPKDSLEALLTGKLPKLWWRKKPLFRHEKWVLSFPWYTAYAQDTQFTVYSLSVLINNQTYNLPWTFMFAWWKPLGHPGLSHSPSGPFTFFLMIGQLQSALYIPWLMIGQSLSDILNPF